MENVKNLSVYDDGNVLKNILMTMWMMGYQTTYGVLQVKTS